ncbi:hypothetical protein [Streptomyces beigongshangae]|uniref:hypothetical protein n=1 Tax=Streptomyces beigongshangae TaxID=2841597 RepID=UPI001C860860|nr:hypothetical protein [Streptomyces sp. REN17]
MSVSTAPLHPGRRRALPAAAAIVAPCPSADYARALARRGTLAVAVTTSDSLSRGHCSPGTPGYGHTVVHDGGLARTSRRLRSLGVRAVLAGSPRGAALAERLADALALPADPATALRRCDRGEQARVLAQAKTGVPCTWRTQELTTALAWWRICAHPAILLLPAAVGAPAAPVLCRSSREIAVAWPQMRRTAHRYSGSTHLILREHLPGRRYTTHSLTRPAPAGGEATHTITDVWAHSHTDDTILARIDLLPRQGMLARALALYTQRVLQILGVRAGPACCHLIYEPGRGPLLLSMAAAAATSPADQVLQAATGINRLGHALDTVLPPPAAPPTAEQPSAFRHIVRVRLNAPHRGYLDERHLAALRALPTVAHCTNSLIPGAPVEQTTSARSAAGEVVLSHPRAQAIEADYQHIRRLERSGLYGADGSR